MNDVFGYFLIKHLVNLQVIFLSSSTKSSISAHSFIHSTLFTKCRVCSIPLLGKIQKKQTGKVSDLQAKRKETGGSVSTDVSVVT